MLSRSRTVPRLTCLVAPADDLTLLPELAAAGVDGFQVRAPGLDTADLLALTATVLDAVRPSDAQVLVNDRVDVALAAGAHGAHLGARDLPVAHARRIAPDLVLGATCRNRGAVLAARDAGADYAGFGPIHATTSKTGLPYPLGVAALAEARGVLPLVAIGGITAANAGAAVRAGAHGVAVIGGLWRQPVPLSAAKELVAAVS